MRVVQALVPPGPGSPNELIDVLLETHGSISQAVLRIPGAIAAPALGRARDAFYWKMAVTQTAILLLPFVDILSLPLALNLGLVLAVLIIAFNAVVGLLSPGLMVGETAIMTRAFKLAVPIALCRYLLGKDPSPGHPHKDLLLLGSRTWLINGVWIAGALTIVATNVQAVPPILSLQAFLTSFLTIHVFTLGVRLQLNPLEGISRHQRIAVTLNRDPYIGDLRRRRYYLLTGADWLSGFSAQALLEMMFFILLSLPLLIGLAELYAGHPGAAEISAPQMAVNGAGWVALLLTWVQLKKLNRQTAAVFDQRIRELHTADRI